MFKKALVVGAAVAVVAGSAAQADTATTGPRRYVILLKDGVGSARGVAADHARAHNAKVDLVYESVVKGYAGEIAPEEVGSLRSDPRVAVVSLDRKVEALDLAPGESVPTGLDRIDVEQASALRPGGTSSVSTPVAVIDSGSGPHADLNVAGGVDCTGAGTYNDANGHGTHVAGTIAAQNRGSGVVGVAPGAPVYSVRVLNASGSGYWSWIVCGIDWVTDTTKHPSIPVANMSLGGSGSDGACSNSALHLAVCRSVDAGTAYMVAAGNSNTNLARHVPATYDQVLTVTAVADFNGLPGGGASATCRSDIDDTGADFSNFATPGSVDASHTIAAPGVCINSTWLNGGYESISGTSMASPHVAGLAALCIANGACATATSPQALMSQLRSDAAARPSSYGFKDDPYRPRNKRYFGYLAYGANY